MTHPRLFQTVLDCTDARALAEFYRELLGYQYRPGHEQVDPAGDYWLVICDASGERRLAFQQVPELPEPTWPEGPRPQMLHLDLAVPTAAELDAQHRRILRLGARLLQDRRDDPQEPLYVYADPAGHPFCVFVSAAAARGSS
jgi:catechol 2,3-dioxygenase-like lactoylglutathione lyase family enzyme